MIIKKDQNEVLDWWILLYVGNYKIYNTNYNS